MFKELLIGKCDIIEHQKVKKADKSTKYEDVTVATDVPCRVSYGSSSTATAAQNLANGISQMVEIFFNPDVEIKPNSKLVITQNGHTVEYKATSQAQYYYQHTEIFATLFDKWS